jgi:hypothetical protein
VERRTRMVDDLGLIDNVECIGRDCAGQSDVIRIPGINEMQAEQKV